VHVDLDGGPLPSPQRVALVTLDGATTVLVHRLAVDGRAPEIGDRVTAVLKPKTKRTGSINDIEGFALA
jgi:uncharacterized OB-fold protein